MTKWLVILSCVWMVACDLPVAKSDESMNSTVKALRYIKDPRTGMCFAMVNSSTYYGYEVSSIALVPCMSIPVTLLVQ